MQSVPEDNFNDLDVLHLPTWNKILRMACIILQSVFQSTQPDRQTDRQVDDLLNQGSQSVRNPGYLLSRQ